MKKTLFFILTLFMLGSYAQNDEIFGSNSNTTQNNDSYMQSAGSHSFEVSFNPGNVFGSGGNAFSLIKGNVKYRNFSTAQKAFRVGVNINFMKNAEIKREADPDNDKEELKKYTTVYGITFMPGTEKHFDVSDRISPYVGVQAILGFKQTSFVEEYQPDNSIETITYINDDGKAGEGFLKFGAGVFTGVDYYFVKRFYIGVELGFGLEYKSILKSKEIHTEDNDNNEEKKHGYSIKLGPGLTTGNIRLGWTF